MIYLIYLFILVSFIDTFSQLPIVSPYALSLGAIPLVIGLIIGAYSFTNIIGNIISGYYIDNKGVKGVASIGLLATAFILFEIGRASCRERVYIWVVDGCVERKGCERAGGVVEIGESE